MSTPAHPGRMLFVNMPVADLPRSKAFFAKLGFSYNQKLTDETAACMLVGEQDFVILLSQENFAEFSKLPMADPATHALALYCFSVSSRDEVDAVTHAALAAADVPGGARGVHGRCPVRGRAPGGPPRGKRLHVLAQLLRPRRPRLA